MGVGLPRDHPISLPVNDTGRESRGGAVGLHGWWLSLAVTHDKKPTPCLGHAEFDRIEGLFSNGKPQLAKPVEKLCVTRPAPHTNDVLKDYPARYQSAGKTHYLERRFLASLAAMPSAFGRTMAGTFGRCEE